MANDQIRTDEEARASIAFADAALNLAGHVGYRRKRGALDGVSWV